MKCQTLFSGKNKKYIINLLSAELALRVVKVKNQYAEFSAFFSQRRQVFFTFCLLFFIPSSFWKGSTTEAKTWLFLTMLNVLKFRTSKCLTKWHMQTVQIQIRLLLSSLIRIYIVCHSN